MYCVIGVAGFAQNLAFKHNHSIGGNNQIAFNPFGPFLLQFSDGGPKALGYNGRFRGAKPGDQDVWCLARPRCLVYLRTPYYKRKLQQFKELAAARRRGSQDDGPIHDQL
jgi:hypothetical protein